MALGTEPLDMHALMAQLVVLYVGLRIELAHTFFSFRMRFTLAVRSAEVALT